MIISDIKSPKFNSYATVTDCIEYAKQRGMILTNDDEVISTLLIKAMDYLEGKNWKGSPTNNEQPLSWPRKYVVLDGVQLSSSKIPKRIIDAQCRLAIEAQTTNLFIVNSGGGEIIQERIEGAMTIQYAEGTRNSVPVFTAVDALLDDLLSGFGCNIRVYRG